ncbi:MAG: chemotaxis protein CheA [Desulfuromonadaceae bacterium]|nr:chemotaxis protein CheA [Desulfuromonadaceae bacterium]MDD5106528.1 chemotaxis protein CheA [Desulfuromonadaceae bacterium]
MDMSPYRDLFVSEAHSHLSAFSELLVQLENAPDDSAAINELFRHAHSLKGMGATMGFEQIVGIAHLMENQLSRIRTGEFRLLPALTDLLLEGGDTLSRLVSLIESGSDAFENTAGLAERLAAFDPATASDGRLHTQTPPVPEDTVQETTSQEKVADSHVFRHSDSFKSVRIKTETLDHLVNITGELITHRHRLAESVRLADVATSTSSLNQLAALLRDLRDEVFKARMLPFSTIAERFPRLVRDLARKQGKEVNFQLEGKEIELDRGILEEIADPIVHILRNAVDHGLEPADDRVTAGKPFCGTISLTVRRDKDHLEIVITDDGRGMDPERLKQKAVEKGLITDEQAARMSSPEAYQLVCAPGFSTAVTVTDISGRGVGMDAVHEAVRSLAGVLTIQSQMGQGSSFIMRMPIAISIIHALMVQCGPFEMAFPLNVVTHTAELKRSAIRGTDRCPTIFLDGAELPFKSLRRLFDLPEEYSGMQGELLPAVICEVAGIPTAFSVDRVIGQQEIFVRPLRSPLSHLHGVSGATITGDGRVLFVADVNALA